MNRLQQLPAALQSSLEQRSTLKVIAGLMNFDAASVERVARAAGHGGADLIDVACDPELVKLAIEASGGVPVCVSSVEPEQFPAAVAAGAEMVEIGHLIARALRGRDDETIVAAVKAEAEVLCSRFTPYPELG